MKSFILIITLFLFANNLQAQLIDIPLVAHWSFDNKSTEDISGNNYHGTPVNTVDYVAGFDGIGSAVRLFGREYKIHKDGNKTLLGSHILLPKINFDSLAEFSITMWVKEGELHLWEGESYIFWGDYSRGWLGIGVFPLLDGTGNPTLYSTYAVGARQNYINDIDPYRDFFDYDLKYKWVFYALTYQDGTIKAYRNRELLGTYEQTINISGDNAAIGCHWISGDSLSARMDMDVDDIRIYHGVLQEDDLQVLQQFCNSSGLIANWTFDEEEVPDTNVMDISGNDLNGKLVETFSRDIGVKTEGSSVVFYGPYANMIAGYMQLPFVNFYHFNEFSVSIWVRERNYDMLQYASYLFYGDWNNGWLGIIRKKENQNIPNSPNSIHFTVGGNQLQNTISIPYDKYWGNIWTNYVMTYKNGILKAYANGKFAGEIAAEIDIDGVNGFSGMLRSSETTSASGSFEGHIDNFRIFCYALDENEIAKIYQPCDHTQFNLNSFQEEYDHMLGIIGNAYITNDVLRLTETFNDKSAVWYGKKVPVREGFETEFAFRVRNGNNNGYPNDFQPGGDGFAFVIYNGGNYEIGEDGPGKANGIKGLKNSIAVEFDLYMNDPTGEFDYNDPNGNHVAIQTGRQLANSAQHNVSNTLFITEDIPLIKSDGSQIYYVKIDYNVEPNSFRVFLDTNGSFSEPIIALDDFDISSIIELEDGSKAFIGFTASTSEVMQTHDILSWSACPFFTFCEDLNAEIISDKDTPICEGDSVMLNLDKHYAFYEWSSGEISEQLTVTETGDYSVKVYDENGCNEEVTFFVDVIPFPEPILNEGAKYLQICEGDSATLKTNDKYFSYLWSTGETLDSIIVTQAGEYSVIVTNEARCSGETSIIVEVIEIPDNKLSLSGNNLLCEGDTLIISAPDGGSYYAWYVDENSSPISNEQTLFVYESGKYYAAIIFGDKCELISDTVEVQIVNQENFLEIDNIIDNTIDFGETTYFNNIYYSLLITNIGDKKLSLWDPILKYGTAFSLPQSQFPMEILPGEQRELIICYYPTGLGAETDSLFIEDICMSIGLQLNGICIEDVRLGNSRCDVPINISTKELPAKWLSTSVPIPNPAIDQVKVEYLCVNNDEEEYIAGYLYDVLGKIRSIAENKRISTEGISREFIESGELIFDVSELASGTYLIVIQSSEFTRTFNIIVER